MNNEREYTDEEIVKTLEDYIYKGYTSTPAEVWLNHVKRLIDEKWELEARVVVTKGHNCNLIRDKADLEEKVVKLEYDNKLLTKTLKNAEGYKEGVHDAVIAVAGLLKRCYKLTPSIAREGLWNTLDDICKNGIEHFDNELKEMNL